MFNLLGNCGLETAWRLILAKSFLFALILVGGLALVGVRVLVKRKMRPGVLKTVLLRDGTDNRSLRRTIADEKLRKRAGKLQSPEQDRIHESTYVSVRQVDAEEPRRLSRD